MMETKPQKNESYLRSIFSNSDQASWMRIMATIVILDILAVWTLSCLFGPGWTLEFSFEDFPWGVVSIVAIMITGKVTQSLGQSFAEPEPCKEDRVERPRGKNRIEVDPDNRGR